MGGSIMGPISTEFLKQVAVTSDKTRLENDPYLLPSLSRQDVEVVGMFAIIAGNNAFADEIAQYFFNEAISSDGSYALDCARAYSNLDAQLHASN